MKNLEKREGYKNRHVDGMPLVKTNINIVFHDIDGEHVFLCEWIPYDKNDPANANTIANGFLGLARVIEAKCKGVGFNVWEQNNDEFIYYNVVD